MQFGDVQGCRGSPVLSRVEGLFGEGEDYVRTGHEKIFVCRNGYEISDCEFRISDFVDGLGEAARAGDAEEVRRRLMEMGRR